MDKTIPPDAPLQDDVLRSPSAPATASGPAVRPGARVSAGHGDDLIASYRPLERSAVRTLLLDADGNLFPSEEPAFVASAEVVNRLLERLGSPKRYDPHELRVATTGKNFRMTAAELAAACGATIDADELEDWVAEEKRAVTAFLKDALTPNPAVAEPLRRLARDFELAAVSSSALSRIGVCIEVTGLGGLLPPARRFSAEDSLPVPTSKPDPAVYTLAARELGIHPYEAVAVEDSSAGVRSAVAAGIQTVGNVCFVAPEERQDRIAELELAGVSAIVASWGGLERLLAA
jgi:beta-phosphoglucomutase-like phosphatase (HAD superfamily)